MSAPPSQCAGEMITPTGACLLRALVADDHFGPPPSFKPIRTGYGAGTKDFGDRPNLVRLVVGVVGDGSSSGRGALGTVPTDSVQHVHGHGHEHSLSNTTAAEAPPSKATPPPEKASASTALAEDCTPDGTQSQHLLCIETNIDDMNPQLFEPIMAQLFAAGARDAWVTPIQMKKGRPAFCLSALCDPSHKAAIADVFLTETTTLGIRIRSVERVSVARRFETVTTP